MNNKRKAFTLVELLVVIAIISLLAALLFGAITRVRENARKTNCLSNMKQLQMAVSIYQQPYDETMPLSFADFDPANNIFEPANGEKGWAQSLQPYIQNTQVFGCPNDSSGVTSDPATSFSDYAYNRALGYVSADIPPRTLADIQSAELTILFSEAEPGNASSSQPTNLNKSGLLTGAAALTGSKLARHMGGSNLVFCDGHAKWYSSVSDTESSKIYAPNTPFKISGESPTFHATDDVTYP